MPTAGVPVGVKPTFDCSLKIRKPSLETAGNSCRLCDFAGAVGVIEFDAVDVSCGLLCRVPSYVELLAQDVGLVL